MRGEVYVYEGCVREGACVMLRERLEMWGGRVGGHTAMSLRRERGYIG